MGFKVVIGVVRDVVPENQGSVVEFQEMWKADRFCRAVISFCEFLRVMAESW